MFYSSYLVMRFCDELLDFIYTVKPFLKTRKCLPFRSFAVVLFIWIGKTKLVCHWILKSTWPNISQNFWNEAERSNSLGFSSYCLHCYCVTTDSWTSLVILDFAPEIYRRKLTAFRRSKGYATKIMRLTFQPMFLSTALRCYV